MNTPKDRKFNTGKSQDYFPFPRRRFKTENHPIIQSKEKCASSTTKTKFSTQELLMLEGLTNSLQCDEREAVRIALYETSRSSSEAYKSAFEYAMAGATGKAHQGRFSYKQWKLPKTEKDQAESTAKELGISNQEFVRLAIIWLQIGIRDGDIKRLTKSKRIPIDTVARQWSRANQGKPPNETVAKFKEARDNARQLSELLKDGNYWETEEFKNLPLAMRRKVEREELLAEAENSFDLDTFIKSQEGDDEEWMIRLTMKRYCCDRDLAIQLIEGEKEQEMIDNMSDKEQINYFRKRKQEESNREQQSPEAKRKREAEQRSREAEQRSNELMKRWRDYRDSLPKTWTAFVEGIRVAKRMMAMQEPYPELPDPLPRDFPMPENWPKEDVSPDDGSDPEYFDCTGTYERQKKLREERHYPFPKVDKRDTRPLNQNDLLDGQT